MIIHIEDYKLPMKIGHFEEEQQFFRPVSISLKAKIKDHMISNDDHLEHTLDYMKIMDCLDSFLTKRKVKLLETVVVDTGNMLLEHFPIIDALDLTVEKDFLSKSPTKGARIRLSHHFQRKD
jgi:FolB domain-containing protein